MNLQFLRKASTLGGLILALLAGVGFHATSFAQNEIAVTLAKNEVKKKYSELMGGLEAVPKGFEGNWLYCGESYKNANLWEVGTRNIVSLPLFQGVNCSKAIAAQAECTASMDWLKTINAAQPACSAGRATLSQAIVDGNPEWARIHGIINGMKNEAKRLAAVDGLPDPTVINRPSELTQLTDRSVAQIKVLGEQAAAKNNICLSFTANTANKDAVSKNVCEPNAIGALEVQKKFAGVLAANCNAFCKSGPANCAVVCMQAPKQYLALYK